ncbi:MAG: arginase family protein [Propionibacteriaceae bacterium]|nr:arginase family protein [Propionibacteriaceae bacterium]
MGSGPAETVVVPTQESLATAHGIESYDVIRQSLKEALAVIAKHQPDRIVTLGGDCSVSVAPFAALAERYGDDLAVVWLDSHPDVGTSDSEYDGFHAMAVALLTGHGDPALLSALPATFTPDRVALAGLHDWTEDDYPNITAWGLTAFSPNDLRTSRAPFLDWLAGTGATKVAIHFDVDTVGSNEAVLGLGQVPHGLTGSQVKDVLRDFEVVGLTVAEFIPRNVMLLQHILSGVLTSLD